jgi:hypothetical protein
VDRRRPARVIVAAFAAGFSATVLCGAAPVGLDVLHPARWLDPGADKARALTTTFMECLVPPKTPSQAYLVEVGRAAFRTPMVLGGQAARAGIACESCHQSGRRNPDFYFPRVSGAPGTADVTSAVFSSHRDDGVDNPKPIPDLSGPASGLKIPRAAPGVLEHFIHGLITEEFDGAEPPPTVLKGLASYIRALKPEACPAATRAPMRVADQAEEARRAVRTAMASLERDDAATAILMIDAARWRLGLINERFQTGAAAGAGAALAVADLDLAAAQAGVRQKQTPVAPSLGLWLARSARWVTALREREAQSLYDPRRLSEAER